ncbi:MAG: ROK family protein [Selenomonadaceae bacterium]|nr:ROK family protein [Selenomonadaceae bacterium]MBQ7493818.1 ROK family protein [Selenomonadaceae bacterium]
MKVLTVDIDGTYLSYACMNEFMNIERRGKIFTPQESRAELIEAVARIFEAVGDAEGIAVSMPGIIDSERGYCAMGGALRYNDDFYFRDALYQRCKTKIHVENNAKCAAMAEAAVGSLMDNEDGFVLIFSTMIGGGYIRNHKIYKGKHFAAGEVSYIILNSGKKLDDENLWGRSFGVPKFLQRYSEVKNMDIETVDLLTIFDAVQKDEPEAVACLQWYTEEIATRIFNIQTVLDVEKFSIGGDLAKYPAFMDYLRGNLAKLYSECPFKLPQAQVVTSKFSGDANLIGALQCWIAENI